MRLWAMTTRSIHDNRITGWFVDYRNHELTILTEFLDVPEKPEYTDIVFSGVLTHCFQNDLGGCILFDITECDPAELFDENVALFESLKNEGWPNIAYTSRADLISQLTKQGIRGFRVDSSYGLNGWIWCQSMEILIRSEAFEPRRVFSSGAEHQVRADKILLSQNVPEGLKKVLIELEKELHSVEARASLARLDQLISDDFREIGASGKYFGKSEVLERLPKRKAC